MTPYFLPMSPYCYLSALTHLEQRAEEKWGKGRWMNLVGSPSFWPHLVMEGDPQERKARAYATQPPFHPHATWDSFSPSLPTPRSLLNLVLCSQTLNVQIFLPLSSIPVKSISRCGAPPHAQVPRAHAWGGHFGSLFFVSAVLRTREQDWERAVVRLLLSLPLCKV